MNRAEHLVGHRVIFFMTWWTKLELKQILDCLSVDTMECPSCVDANFPFRQLDC